MGQTSTSWAGPVELNGLTNIACSYVGRIGFDLPWALVGVTRPVLKMSWVQIGLHNREQLNPIQPDSTHLPPIFYTHSFIYLFILEYSCERDQTTYAEVDCNGGGSDTSNRVEWKKNLTSSEVSFYTSLSFVDTEGWLSQQPWFAKGHTPPKKKKKNCLSY